MYSTFHESHLFNLEQSEGERCHLSSCELKFRHGKSALLNFCLIKSAHTAYVHLVVTV